MPSIAAPVDPSKQPSEIEFAEVMLVMLEQETNWPEIFSADDEQPESSINAAAIANFFIENPYRSSLVTLLCHYPFHRCQR